MTSLPTPPQGSSDQTPSGPRSAAPASAPQPRPRPVRLSCWSLRLLHSLRQRCSATSVPRSTGSVYDLRNRLAAMRLRARRAEAELRRVRSLHSVTPSQGPARSRARARRRTRPGRRGPCTGARQTP